MADRVVVIGQGYVGLPVAVLAAERGFEVVGFDVDTDRIDGLASGHSHVEDIDDARLRAVLEAGHYTPSSESRDLAGFDVAVVSVPTPMSDGLPDLSHVESATRTLGRFLRPGATVILESTTYPGTTEELVGPILEELSGLRVGDFSLGYSPERIDPGNPTWTLENTPKVVSGVDTESLARVQGFFETLVDQTVPVSSPREAELTKLLENTFRHVNIALVNELAMFANDLGIDLWEAIDAASTKPFGYMRFTPGPGVGGHCLPIDPSFLSWRVERSLGHTFRFVELANDVNGHMPEYVVRRVQDLLNTRGLAVSGSRVLMFGISYKANTGDARETPALPIAEGLNTLGADLCAVDPYVADAQFPDDVERVDGTTADIAAADLILYLVDHELFDKDAVVAGQGVVLDCRNALKGDSVVQL